jgi:DNA-binding NtrC family response regulator
MDRRVLIIDDDESMLELLRAELAERQYDVRTQTSPEGALRLLAETDFSAVLSDIRMQGMSGVDLCREVVALREDTPFVVMTAFSSTEAAVAAIRAGAYDFVSKPIDADELALTLERAIRHRELRQEVRRLRNVVGAQPPFGDMIGRSAPMVRMYDVVSRVAATDATVLVSGESGTGKELVAKALHARSGRASGPFVAISCAAMPASLLESELFGHEKGAFTDARTARAGLLASAAGGTLFLDEIGEMPMEIQPKLLRALQERKARPVGGNTEVHFDVRIVAATNRDLEEEVEKRHFREDLYYRINVVHVRVPALREREEDVLLLAQSFLQACQAGTGRGERVVGITSAAAERLSAYSWPGNVRELHNCIERAVALAQFDHLHVDDLPERIRHYKAPRPGIEAVDPTTMVPLEEVERRYVLQVLEAMGGNKVSAARALGVDRRTLYRKLERWARAVPRGDSEAGGRHDSPRDAAAC